MTELRVLHVIPAFQPAVWYGGPVFSVSGLCQGLLRHGADVRVLTTDSAGPHARLPVQTDKEVEWEAIPVRYCRRVYPESISFSLLAALPGAMSWADVVHLTGIYNFPTFPCLAWGRMTGKPVVWSPRGALLRWEGSRKTGAKAIWDRAANLLAPSKLLLHATSDDERERSEMTMPGRRWCVVPNGTGIGAARGERQPGPPRLLFVGRIDPIKALDNLIAALGKLPEAVALTIAGQGDAVYVETLRRQCAAAGVSGQVRFTGFADGAAKAKLYAEADLAITPSHSENFGMVVAEALGHGVPVVVSRGTPWQRVEREGCGLWVGNRPEELAAAVTQALRMDLRAMGERGRAWMEREYSWDGRAKEMLAVYESLRRPVSSTEMDRHA